MWKPDFGTVDGAVAHRLNQGEEFMIVWVLYEFVERQLGSRMISENPGSFFIRMAHLEGL